MYVEIAFPISSYKIFSYQVPSKLCDQIKIGIRVKAHLNKRKLTGIIVEVSNSNKYSGKTFFIDEIIDDGVRLDNNLFLLLKWVSKYYIAPLGRVLKVALPKKLSSNYKPKSIVEITYRKNNNDLLKNAPAQLKTLNFIKKQNKPVFLSSLKHLTSTPSSVCRELLNKEKSCDICCCF